MLDDERPFLPSTGNRRGINIKARSLFRYILYLVVFVVLVWTLDVFYYRTGFGENFALYHHLYEVETNRSNDICVVPKFDPFDSTISQYIEREEPLTCRKIQPILSVLDNFTLIWNLDGSGYAPSDLTCSYRCIERGKTDFDVNYREWNPVTLNASRTETKVSDCEVVEVSCQKNSLAGRTIYSYIHAQIVPQSHHNIESLPPLQARKPDVMLFVIDSVSRANAIRQLPLTLDFLQKNLSAYVFDSYVKVADNSFPNAMAFLAGEPVLLPGIKSTLPEDMRGKYFDDWPLIWRNFSAEGYRTLSAEDYPDFNLFTHHANGFKADCPVDHCMRPFWVSIWKTVVLKRSSHLCYGSTPKHVLQMRYLGDFWRKYSKYHGQESDAFAQAQPSARTKSTIPVALSDSSAKNSSVTPDEKISVFGYAHTNAPKFALSWLVELSHDYLNLVGVGDRDLRTWLEEMEPYLKNTVLFYMSDHGHRFDKIRESVIGRIEERMPFLSVSIPRWMRESYPTLVRNIEANTNRLSSPFDLFATLSDILNLNWSPDVAAEVDSGFENPLEGMHKGTSLFRPLSSSRSCADAWIPDDFCVCQREVTLNTSDPLVRRSADVLVHEINNRLKKVVPPCAVLSIAEVRRGEAFLPNAKVVEDKHVGFIYKGSKPSGMYINYRIQLVASPSLGLFEGTVRHDLIDDTMVIPPSGDIARLNRYGNQSSCITDQVLEKYCFCP